VERTEGELALSLQADLLSLSRSSLYYQPRPPSAEEVRLKHRIDEVYTQSPFYGSRKIAAQLQREGMGIKRKTVARYMQEMGIAAIYPGPQSLVNGTKRKECIRTRLAPHHERLPPSYLGHRYHVYSLTSWLDVSGGDPGLVLALRRQLGTRSNLGVALCAHRNATGAGTNGAIDLQ
jgi:hypothetical protein